MNNTYFTNATGWPHPDLKTTSRDLIILTRNIINNFPKLYELFNEKIFTYNNIKQSNRNPLLYSINGADGLKTGHTNEAGYGLVGSARQGQRRIIFMITGLESKAARANEAEKLTNWAFRQFVIKDLFKKDEVISKADVWLGENKTIDLIAEDNISGLFPLGSLKNVDIEINYKGPIAAPIKKGDRIAILTVNTPNIGKS